MNINYNYSTIYIYVEFTLCFVDAMLFIYTVFIFLIVSGSNSALFSPLVLILLFLCITYIK